MRILNKTNALWLATIVCLFLIIQVSVVAGLISPVYQQTLVTILINIILATGLNLIVGFSGQLALGHAGFMAIGAYATGIITKETPGLGGFLISVAVGIIIAGIIAVIVGFPTLRLKGDYLAIATLGVG